MVPREFLKTVAARVGISDNELEVMARAIQGEPMTAISKQLGVRKDALQKRLGEVYRKLNISGAGPGKLAKTSAKVTVRISS
jgi:Bacterial regulatory proteins, luxR family.